MSLAKVLVKFVIDPIHEQRMHIGLISDALIFYADTYSNPGIRSDEVISDASNRLRSLASQLMARSNAISAYALWSWMGLVPKWRAIVQAREQLIFLHNSLGAHGDPVRNGAAAELVEALLRIRNR